MTEADASPSPAGAERILVRVLLADLLADAVRDLNRAGGVDHRTSMTVRQGEPALEIDPAVDAAPLTLPRSQAPGVILGRTPESFEEARRLVVDGINRFLREHLGARSAIVE